MTACLTARIVKFYHALQITILVRIINIQYQITAGSLVHISLTFDH